MSFTSLTFAVFVAFFVCIYFSVPLKYRWGVLLVASYSFYIFSSPQSFVFLLITTVSTYLGGRKLGQCDAEMNAQIASEENIDRARKKEIKEQTKARKKKWMLLVLVFNFGILAVLKYFRIYVEMLSEKFSIEWLHFDAGILIPLGISFYTFQSMSYIIDLYRSKYEPEKSLPHFALFVSWFPLIMQGPISRYNQLAHQLYEGHKFDYTRVKFGLQLIMWGAFKKLVIADRLDIFVDSVFDNFEEYRGLYMTFAVIFYSIQVYADFSGGIDIARGVSQIFGITLTDNFNQPYFAQDIQEFWRRWHISLGQWCRDYIFYPLTLSKSFGRMGKKARGIIGDKMGKLFPVIVAQLITFFIIGIWHGAAFKYIAYGLYQAFFINFAIILEDRMNDLNKLLKVNTEAPSWKLFRIMRTFGICVAGRYFSRADNFIIALRMLKRSFEIEWNVLFNGAFLELGLTARDFYLLFFCFILWIGVSSIREKGYSVRELIAQQNLWFRWSIYIVGFLSILIFGVYGIGFDANSFIYRGF